MIQNKKFVNVKIKKQDILEVYRDLKKGDEFDRIAQQNEQELQKQIKSFYDLNSDFLDFYNFLLDNNILVRLCRSNKEKQLKWPKNLEINKYDQSFDKSAFYSWNISQSNRKKQFILIVSVLAIYFFNLISYWPLNYRIAVIYLGAHLFFIFISILIIRMFIFIIFKNIGISAWIFPNIFEDRPFIYLFKPLYTYEKNKNFQHFARIGMYILILYLCFDRNFLIDLAKSYQNYYFDQIFQFIRNLENQINVNPNNQTSQFEKKNQLDIHLQDLIDIYSK